ncbi:hypothetical protein [Cerasicoccus fimbriatus]|uniref:hypothetical protein n=1 Tax=Cerasicoccus fimbriatus TaxID=3014554 RepID=UPI0022B2DAAC|nr:hypothetical protein [Cerasicoccus sp. TK19100]
MNFSQYLSRQGLRLAVLSTLAPLGAGATIVVTGFYDPAEPFWSDGGDASTDGGIGVFADGGLTVDGGSVLALANGGIGVTSGATGTASVSGSGSAFTTSYLGVGVEGNGYLTASDYGLVSAVSDLVLGFDADASGYVTVETSAQINAGYKMQVGYDGYGELTVQTGGYVSSYIMNVASYAGSEGLITVTGAGSQLEVLTGIEDNEAGDFIVGRNGVGTLSISDGGSVLASFVDLGFNGDAEGYLYVTGADSSLDVSDNVIIGDYGYGSINISNGGALYGYDIIFGYESEATGEGMVTGANSLIQADDDILVGLNGYGELTLENGAEGDVADDIYVGYNPDSEGYLTVTGANTTLTLGDNLYVGDEGYGSVTFSDGAYADVDDFYLADSEGSTGIGLITDAGTQVDVADDVDVGYAGLAELTINSGALFNVGGDVTVGYEDGSDGELLVTGADTTMDVVEDIRVGYYGIGQMTISDGASVSSDYGIAGAFGGEGSVTVETGGSWTTDRILYVDGGEDDQLLVQNGGLLYPDDFFISAHPDAKGSATITGVLSELGVTDEISVGRASYGTLLIDDGSTASGYRLRIGHLNAGDGYVTVDNGASLTLSDSIEVGTNGMGNLTVSNSASVTTNYMEVGLYASGTGSVTVESNGHLTVNNDLNLGNSGSASLLVQSGGIVDAQIIDVAYVEDSTGNITVQTGGQLNSTGDIAIGVLSTGTMDILDGGVVNTGAQSYVGNGATGVGVVNVDGAGSQWNGDQSLTIGNGGTGTVNVANGGKLNFGWDVVIKETGTLNLTVDGNDMVNTGQADEPGWGDFLNMGLVTLVADSTLEAGVYEPINIADGREYYNSGTVTAVGGLWDDATQQFTVGAVVTADTAPSDLSGQRVSYFDNALVVGFGSDAGEQSFTATKSDVSYINGNPVIDAYQFESAITGTTSLSFVVGEGLDAATISIWYLADGETEWVPYDSALFEYYGGVITVTVEHFSSYAVAVPEPSANALVFAFAVLLIVIKRRRQAA